MREVISRRNFLKLAGVTAAACTMGGSLQLAEAGTASAAQTSSFKTSGKAMKIYDFEHHFYSKDFYDYLMSLEGSSEDTGERFKSQKAAFAMNISNNFPEGRVGDELLCKDDLDLKIMDNAGLQYGVVSSSDGIEIMPREASVEISRKTNDATAAKVKEHPDRFLGTFCLPTPYVEESLQEIDRAVNELGLQYFHTHSSYGNERLSDEKYEPIIKKCAEMNLPIYIHPCYPDTIPYLAEMGLVFAGAGFGFGVDVMKTFDELVIGGVFDRHPNLRIILGHMGEFLPYLLVRMDNMLDVFRGTGIDPKIKCKKNFGDYIKNGNVFVTTSGIFDEEVVKFAINRMGIDHILFGADFPYECCKRSVDFIKSLHISDEEKEKICWRNAEQYILRK